MAPDRKGPRAVRIGEREVGEGQLAYVIAEAGVNHNGSLDRAIELVDVAAASGADAVKFQTFDAEELVTAEAPKAAYQLAAADPDESQLDMLRALELSYKDHVTIFQHAEVRGITCLSTPFDGKSADLLNELGVPAFKIGSGELTNIPLIRQVASYGKPVLVSTGMSDLDEVRAAVDAVTRVGGGERLILLHCVSNYPAAPADANLRAMETLRKTFQVPVGFSDHTLGYAVATAAVALGANVIEKHFTLDRTLPGPDHLASLEPGELAAMINALRVVETALGDGEKKPAPSEQEMRMVARRSLVATVRIDKGTRLTAEMLTAKRPGGGIPPSELPQIVGRAAAATVEAGEMLTREKIQL